MTRAPSNLLAVRRLLLTHLDVDEDRSRSQDLEPAEVGIVGDADHRGGYHCGEDRVDLDDYSVDESPRDRAGLTLDAAALDVGMFTATTPKGTYDLPHFSAWCVAQCKAGATDARDIREIIWSPDSRVVRRWDALGIRSTGDTSHRWHTHFSFFRDAIKAGRDLTPLVRRYLTTIGLIPSEDDMSAEQVWTEPLPLPGRVADRLVAKGWSPTMSPWEALARVVESVIIPRDLVDEQEVAEALAPLLTAAPVTVVVDQLVAAGIAQAVANELASRLQG